MKRDLANLGIALAGQLAITVLVVRVPPTEITLPTISTMQLWPKYLLTASMVCAPLVVFLLRHRRSERTSVAIVKGAVAGPILSVAPVFLVFGFFLGDISRYIEGGIPIGHRIGAALYAGYFVCLIALVAGGLVALLRRPVATAARRLSFAMEGDVTRGLGTIGLSLAGQLSFATFLLFVLFADSRGWLAAVFADSFWPATLLACSIGVAPMAIFLARRRSSETKFDAIKKGAGAGLIVPGILLISEFLIPGFHLRGFGPVGSVIGVFFLSGVFCLLILLVKSLVDDYAAARARRAGRDDERVAKMSRLERFNAGLCYTPGPGYV